jgi:pentatricopeptide repeat protein
MCYNHLQKILLSLKTKSLNIKFLDQILTQTITTGFTYSTPTWNCLIRAYSRSPTAPIKAILVYNFFIKTCSTRPDNYTYPCLLKACSRLFTDSNGKQVHTHVIKTGLDSDIYVQNALVHFYGSVGNSTDACFLFDRMPDRDVASWNSLMGIYNTNNSFTEVMVLFKKLMCGCVKADKISLVIVLSACAQAQMEGLEYGRSVHGYVIKVGFGCFLNVDNALLNFYIKCKEIDDASKMFDEFVHEGDVVSYTILINAYVEMGLIDLARDVFDEIVDKDRVLWNLMVHAYVKARCPNEALDLFEKMDSAGVIPDENTMVSVLLACASISDLQCARLLHRFINRNSNVRQDVFLKTALITMYSKCGSVEEALVTFYKMEYTDVFTWTAMIEGLANNGYGNEALSMFNRMENQGIRPNEATLVSVLTACIHSGLVKEGCQLFKSMVSDYKMQLKMEHFGCLIDLLSRAGLLHQAEEFIQLLLPQERLIAYKTLLSACMKYSEFDFGKKVANEMSKLSSNSHETRILLSNFYALAGQWAQVAETRKFIKEFDTRKAPGMSFVDVKP